MKKNVLTYILACLLVFLYGCDKTENQDTYFTLFSNEGSDYYVVDDIWKMSSDESRYIKFPRFESNYHDCTKINSVLKAALEEHVTENYGDDLSDCIINYDYEIKHLNNSFTSIVFSGMFYKYPAAHPDNSMFSINILLDKPETIDLLDTVEIDDDFIQKFRQGLQKLSPIEIAEYLNSYSDAELKKDLNYSRFWASNENFGIIFYVPHAIGDTVSVEIPLTDIKSKFKALP